MRLLILLSICLINMVQANNSYAQKATISINVHNQTVKEVLNKSSQRLISNIQFLIKALYLPQKLRSKVITRTGSTVKW